MDNLTKILTYCKFKNLSIKVEMEGQYDCFYIVEVKPYYLIEFHIDWQDRVSDFKTYHSQAPEYIDIFTTIDKAVQFCYDMNKRFEAVNKNKA